MRTERIAVPLLPVIRERATRRAFSDRPVDPDTLESLLEAARWAPSSKNSQPARFIVVQDPEVRQRLHPAFTPSNQLWVGKVPVFIVIAANPQDDGEKEGQPLYLFDCGLAAMNLMLQAVHCGLQPVPMVGWKEPAVKEVLDIPEEVRVVCIIAVGYLGDADSLHPEIKAKDARPRVRKPLQEVAFRDGWGNPYA